MGARKKCYEDQESIERECGGDTDGCRTCGYAYHYSKGGTAF